MEHAQAEPVERADVLVVGGGPAGLASAHMLERRGLRTIVLEAGDRPGHRWYAHYRRLRLHTHRALSGLPDRAIPRSAGRWVARDELAAYLDRYARGLDVRPHHEAALVDRAREGWRVVLAGAAALEARSVVVATGMNNVPHVPDWPGATRFRGTLLHSRDYRDGTRFRGQSAVVVGPGNSGAEIALDLLEHGATDVALAVRTPTNVVGRTVLGVPVQAISLVGRRLPTRSGDRTFAVLSRLSVGDYVGAGFPRPRYGSATQLRVHGRTPVLDVGTVAAVRAGRIDVVAGVIDLDADGVVLADGARRAADVVVAATGYLPGLEPLVGHLDVLDRRGWPRHAAAPDPTAAGLYFVGFVNAPGGILNEISREARRIARTEAGRQAGEPRPAPAPQNRAGSV